MAQNKTSGSVSTSVQPLSQPSSTLMYMDYTYGKSKKSKRGRPSSMRRFKIKYTNTKGIIKTRNIKATSEERAMSEISDMSQHHYTIVETLDEPEPARVIKNPCTEIQLPSGFTVAVNLDTEKIKQEVRELEEKRKMIMEKWAPIMDKVDPNMGANKKEWLSKYAQYHQDATQDAVVTYDPYSLIPIARRVFAQAISLDLSEFKEEKDGGYDDSLSQEDWDAGNSYDGFTQPASNDSWNG